MTDQNIANYSSETLQNSTNFMENPVYWTYSPDENRLLYISPNCKDLTGFEPTDFYLNPKLWLNLIQDEDKNRKAKVNLSGDKLTFESEYFIKSTENQMKKITEIVYPVLNHNDQLLMVNGIVFVKNDRKENFKVNLVKFPIPYLQLLLSDNSIKILSLSEKLIELFSYQNNTVDLESLFSNSEFKSLIEQIKNRISNNFSEDNKFEFTIRNENQSNYFQFVIDTQKSGDSDSLITVFGFDITDFKLNEKRLTKLNNDKNKLLSIVSHDLKSPFNTILSFIDMLRSGIDLSEEEKNEFLNFIYNNAKSQLELIHDMLDWSKIESGLLDFTSTYIQLKQILNKIITSFGGQAYQKEIHFEVKVKKSINVFFDKNYLKIILSNIISNAIKFSHKRGKIVIDAIEDDDYTHVIIQDFGIGISERYIALLRQSKDYISQVGTMGEKGTGLGLKFCYDILNANFGKMDLESKPQKGTKVRLSFKKPKHNILYFNDEFMNNEIKSINMSLLPDVNLIVCHDIFDVFLYIEKFDIELLILNLDIIKNFQTSFIERVFHQLKENAKIIGFTSNKDESLTKLQGIIRLDSIINSAPTLRYLNQILSDFQKSIKN